MKPNALTHQNLVQPIINSQPNFTPVSNHGGHEMFDVHEILSSTINVLDQYMIFRTFVQSHELIGILDRQYHFILSQYNLTAECFATGQKPHQETATYMIPNMVTPVYGLQPTAPKKPNQCLADVKDAGISGHMLGLIKSHASLLGMSANEITNGTVRRVIASQIQHFIEMAYEIFMFQNKNAYYQVPQLSPNDTQQMLQAYIPATGAPDLPMNNHPLH